MRSYAQDIACPRSEKVVKLCLFSNALIQQFLLGGSSVMCSVVGPTEVKIRDEKLDKATIDIVARPLVGLPGIKDKALEQNIRETLEPLILSGLHPRTMIQLVVQTMKDDGSVRHNLMRTTNVMRYNP